MKIMKWPGSAGFAVAVVLAAGLAVMRGGGPREDVSTNQPVNLQDMKDFKKPDAAQLKRTIDAGTVRGHAEVGHGTGVPQRVLEQHETGHLRGRGVG